MPAQSPSIARLQANPDLCRNTPVGWGGLIIKTENHESTASVTILSLPLDEEAEPRSSDKGLGRFIAEFDSFREPAIYKANRRITISGRCRDMQVLKIGEYDYHYPIIEVEASYLWPEQTYRDGDYDPWYPYYYPYYPYYPHHHHHRRIDPAKIKP